MPIDFQKKTFETSAIELRDDIGILAGIGVPWDDYINVTVGSRFFKADGKVYRKIGTGDSQANWVLDFDPDDDDNGDDDTYRNRWFWAFNGTQSGIAPV